MIIVIGPHHIEGARQLDDHRHWSMLNDDDINIHAMFLK